MTDIDRWYLPIVWIDAIKLFPHNLHSKRSDKATLPEGTLPGMKSGSSGLNGDASLGKPLGFTCSGHKNLVRGGKGSISSVCEMESGPAGGGYRRPQ